MNIGLELNEIADRLLDESTASHELPRFLELLQIIGDDSESITSHEHWSLYYKITGNIPRSVVHSKKQIELIGELLEIDGPVGPVDYHYLANAMLNLADLLMLAGNADEAAAVTERANELWRST